MAGRDVVELTTATAPAGRPALAASPVVSPNPPWIKPDPQHALTRIGVGSCLSQAHPQPIWNGILGLPKKPDLFLMIGDNVYGDIRSSDARELRQAYADQAHRPELAAARMAMPFLATWDDHDYGVNDGGAGFEHQKLAAQLFYEYWQVDPPRPAEEGIYRSHLLGPKGRRIQIILLDTRSFRSPLQRKSQDFPYWGRYEPLADPSRTMLGNAQWAWLAEQLAVPADLRLLISSVQVLASGHGFERWGNLPLEKQRLLELIAGSGAGRTVLLSGDRHFGAIYQERLPNGQILLEMTSSSLNRSYGPSKDGPSPNRIGRMFNVENFGLIDIDWEKRNLTVTLNGMSGQLLARHDVTFGDLEAN